MNMRILWFFFGRLGLEKILSKNQVRSKILRRYYADYHNLEVGLYSYGCFDVNRFPAGTKVGRYCSIANDASVLNANHLLDAVFLHPFLYNPIFGLVKRDLAKRTSLLIGDDVWVGSGVRILPSVKRIGTGAVIGAGSVVTKDVSPYSVVCGNPAKVIKFRFSESVIQKLVKLDVYSKNEEWIKKNLDKLYNAESFVNE